MGIVRDIITPILPVVLGIAIGAGGVRMWQWVDYTRALESERSLTGERDKLVSELATVKAQRDQAQANARRERQAIYDGDKDAAAWARQPVPDVLAKRVRDAARAAQRATSTASGTGVSESP